jgi:putative ABC transport system permease protein
MAIRLREYLDSRGLKVTDTQTAAVTQTQNNLLFTVVVAFLILMALLLAAVGGLGLTTTMSINIMERVREVGVLRAIGASNGSVRQIVLAEGIAMAVISWIVGALISLGLAPLFSAQLGLALIKIPLQYHYSFLGAAAWFFILLVIAAGASLAPARNAVRLTVREVLAYE